MTAGRLMAAALLILAACKPGAEPATEPRDDLYLITALPLVWAEGFGLDQPQAPVIAKLEEGYRVTPVDLPSQVPESGLLLIAQPRALPAEELVALDAWVRRGGRLVLLADPLLEWESDLPLGDPGRAPPMFADTGLLGHWGLRLDSPDERGEVGIELAGQILTARSPGRLVVESGDCRPAPDSRSAECRLGRGRAIVVADADWLNEPDASDLLTRILPPRL